MWSFEGGVVALVAQMFDRGGGRVDFLRLVRWGWWWYWGVCSNINDGHIGLWVGVTSPARGRGGNILRRSATVTVGVGGVCRVVRVV